jgi:hypothetical protein
VAHSPLGAIAKLQIRDLLVAVLGVLATPIRDPSRVL